MCMGKNFPISPWTIKIACQDGWHHLDGTAMALRWDHAGHHSCRRGGQMKATEGVCAWARPCRTACSDGHTAATWSHFTFDVLSWHHME